MSKVRTGLAMGLLAGAILSLLPAAADQTTPPRLDTSGVNLQPAYPVSALASHERGGIVLNVDVNDKGTVTRILPLQSSGFNDLDAAAIATVLGWRFTPATKNRVPVEGWAKEQIVFQSPDEPPAPLAASTTAYLPVSLDLDSGDQETASQSKPVPCARGEVRATVEVRTLRRDASSAGITLGAGDEEIEIRAIQYRDSEKVILLYRHGSEGHYLAFNNIASVESFVALTLSWEPDGTVTGRIGKSQSQQLKLSAGPTSFGFIVRGAAASFRTPQLICLAAATPPE